MRKFSEYSSAGALSVWVKPSLHKRAQPRSQSSSAISDVTSPVKHVKPPLVSRIEWTGLGTRLKMGLFTGRLALITWSGVTLFSTSLFYAVLGVQVPGWVISVNHRRELTICMYVMKQPMMDNRYFAIKLNFWQKDDFKIVYTCKTIFWLLIHITEVYQISHLLEYPSFI